MLHITNFHYATNPLSISTKARGIASWFSTHFLQGLSWPADVEPKQQDLLIPFPSPTSQIRNQSRHGKHWMNSSGFYTRGSFPQRETSPWHPPSHYIIFNVSTGKYTGLGWNIYHLNPPVLPVQALQQVNGAGRAGVQEKVPGKFCPEMRSGWWDKAQHWHVAEKPPDTNRIHPVPLPNSRGEHKSNLTDYILCWSRRPLIVKLLMSTLLRKAETHHP